jgi:hypothetical protein
MRRIDGSEDAPLRYRRKLLQVFLLVCREDRSNVSKSYHQLKS